MTLDSMTLGQIADAVTELRRLREQVTQLQASGTREVERRRRLESTLAEALRLAELYGGWNPEDLAMLRHAINACPACGSSGDEPCRTENVRAALPVPHEEREADEDPGICGGSKMIGPEDALDDPTPCPGCVDCAGFVPGGVP